MSYETLLYEIDGPVLTVTLNRPEKLNAYTAVMGIELGSLGVVLLAVGLLLSFAEAWRLPTGLRGPPLSGMAATVVAATFLSNPTIQACEFWSTRPPYSHVPVLPAVSQPMLGLIFAAPTWLSA